MSMYLVKKTLMYKLKIFIILNIVFLSACNFKELEGEFITGLYFSYEGAEYETVFMPCNTKSVWITKGDQAFKELIELYGTVSHSKYGEIFIKAQGNLEPMDKTQFPNSHYAGTFSITKLASHSTRLDVIEECRNINE